MAQLAHVIKYEGDNQTFIWKHPEEDFEWGTQLIVHETQEAIFFLNGQALDTFGPGRHTLETQTMPLLARIFSSLTGNKSAFHAEVYFINKTEQMGIKWGTDSKMEYIEPTYGFPIQLGACGEMTLRISDGRKLLLKVVGTENGIDQHHLVQNFRAFLMTKVKPYIVKLIKEQNINIFQIDEMLQSMSEALHQALIPDFQDYGVALERFFLVSIVKPEDDKNYRRFKEIHFRQYADVAEAQLRQKVGLIDQETAAKRMVIEAQGLASKRSIEGYDYQTERGFDVADRVAANQSIGQFTNMGVGMGMIAGVGAPLSNTVGGLMSGAIGQVTQAPKAETPAHQTCAKCGATLLPNAKFCPECGERVVVQEQAPETVTCPQCGAKVPPGKFCAECGAKLINTCPQCGKEVQPNVKFCPDCGTKLN